METGIWREVRVLPAHFLLNVINSGLANKSWQTFCVPASDCLRCRPLKRLSLLYFSALSADPTTLMPTLWVGTSLGSALTVSFTLPDVDARNTQPVIPLLGNYSPYLAFIRRCKCVCVQYR